MLKRIFQPKYLLIVILAFTFFSRVIRLDYPKGYVFDEVYHAFTAKEYLKENIAAWEYWTKPPPGVAYEWTHPPLAKEIMTVSMYITGSTDAWAYRLPGVIFGTLAVFLVFILGKFLFKNETIALLSAFIFSIDGLNFVQSRTGMNDIYFVTFMLASIAFFTRKKFFWSAVLFGLALSSKWTTLYLFGLYFILLIRYRYVEKIFLFVFIPLAIYLISYLPFFLLGHSFNQFIDLQKQMWWYHTGLKAHHDYSSPWWSWPLNLYPVWYFVEYLGKNIANIFASGNPLVFWSGFVAIIFTLEEVIKKFIYKKKVEDSLFEGKLIALGGYFIFFLPWALSPRIMFLYHYSPSVPFLSLILGYQLNFLNNKKYRPFLIIFLIFMLEGFVLLYPFLTGIPLSRQMTQLFFYTNITKNPF